MLNLCAVLLKLSLSGFALGLVAHIEHCDICAALGKLLCNCKSDSS